jgi:hypothetical protein
MRPTLCFLFVAFALSLQARDYVATVVDEEARPLPDAAVSALFGRMNDPRDASMRTFEGKTDERGVFRFAVGEEMLLVRLRAEKPGHFDADLTEGHGLGHVPGESACQLTLPKRIEGIPLCYKEVRLSSRDGNLPPRTWVGFDLARGDVVRPWGKGETPDISFWNEGEKVGWTQSEQTIERYRHDKDHARLSDDAFEAMYSAYRGVTRLRCGRAGDGLMRSPSFWPYCRLKMPAKAPETGYAASLELSYATLPSPAMQDGFVGYFLRVRSRVSTDGRVVSAHYAKIQGAIRHDFGMVSFRYYYNPTEDDRRLAHDVKTNLLGPLPGTAAEDLDRYRSYEP